MPYKAGHINRDLSMHASKGVKILPITVTKKYSVNNTMPDEMGQKSVFERNLLKFFMKRYNPVHYHHQILTNLRHLILIVFFFSHCLYLV